jgi:O-antigen/teichoic acid export membrane protein
VVATANAGTTLLGPILLERDAAGLMVLALGVGYFATHLNRAFVGDVLIALAPRYDEVRRAELVRDGLATALVVGLVGSVAFVGIWWFGSDRIGLRDLIWVAPFLPALMVQDTARCGYLAVGEPVRAMRVNLVWVLLQAALVGGMVITQTVTAGGLLVAWGVGAAASAGVHLVRATGAPPWRGSPRRWLTRTRHLASWFTATAIIGQVHLQAVNFMVAVRLSPVEVSGLRFVQTILMQPVQNVVSAAQLLMVPGLSRAAHQGAVTAVRQQTVRLALGLGALGLGLVLTVWPVAELVLSGTDRFADVAPLALPVSIQAAVYLVQSPFTAALRGMHRTRMLFAQYVVFSVVGLVGLTVGASVNQLPGAVWGLASGTFAGLVVMIGCFVRALATLPAGTAKAT